MTADAGIIVLPTRVTSTSPVAVIPSPTTRPRSSGGQRGTKTRASRALKKSNRGTAKSANSTPTGSGTTGKKRRKPSSSYRGVTWNKWHQKWTSQIRYGGKQHHLGVFADPVQAARAYDAAAFEHHKAKAVLNFPEDQEQLRKDQQQRLEQEKAKQKETEQTKKEPAKAPAQKTQQHPKNEYSKPAPHEKRKSTSLNALDRGMPLPQLDINLDAPKPPKKIQRFDLLPETQPLRQQENMLARNSVTLHEPLLLPSEGSRELEQDLRTTAALQLPLDIDLSLSAPALQQQPLSLTREAARSLQQRMPGLHTGRNFSSVVASELDPLASVAPSPLARQQYIESSPAPALAIAAAAASAPEGLSLTGKKTGALKQTRQSHHADLADERRRHSQLQQTLTYIHNSQQSGSVNRPAPLGFGLHGLDRTQSGLGNLLGSSRDSSSGFLSPFDSPKLFSPSPMSLLHNSYKYAGADNDALDKVLLAGGDVTQQKPMPEGLALR